MSYYEQGHFQNKNNKKIFFSIVDGLVFMLIADIRLFNRVNLCQYLFFRLCLRDDQVAGLKCTTPEQKLSF